MAIEFDPIDTFTFYVETQISCMPSDFQKWNALSVIQIESKLKSNILPNFLDSCLKFFLVHKILISFGKRETFSHRPNRFRYSNLEYASLEKQPDKTLGISLNFF